MFSNGNFSSIIDPLPTSDTFDLLFVSASDSSSSLISDTLQQNSPFFDRFVFLYSKIDSSIIQPFFADELVKGDKFSKKKILFPLFFADNPVKDTLDDLPPGLFSLFDFQDRIIQLLGFTLNQFIEFFTKRNIDDVPTFLFLINLDRQCFQSGILFRIYSDLIPLLTPRCKYLALSQNIQAYPFYNSLAFLLKKMISANNNKNDNRNDQVPNWHLLTLGEDPLEFEPNDFVPSNFVKSFLHIQKEIPGLDILISGNNYNHKQGIAQKIVRSKFGKGQFQQLRRFSLTLLIANRLSYKTKLLVFTNNYDQHTWEDFRKKFKFPVYKSEYNPIFISTDIMAQIGASYIESFEHVILDLGDNINPTLNSSEAFNILEQAILANTLIPSTPVTFFHPLLIPKNVFEWIIRNPPIPWHLVSLTNHTIRKKELIFLGILLTVQKRIRKVDFNVSIQSSWILSSLDVESLPIIQYTKTLRSAGLLDRQHFQITALGKFFIKDGLLISSFLSYLQKRLPNLFTQDLAIPLDRLLFLDYYFLCAEWYFLEKKQEDYNESEWLEFIKTIPKSCRISHLPERIQNEAITLVTNLLSQKLKNNPVQYSKRTIILDEQSIQEIKTHKNYTGEAVRWAIRDIRFWMNSLKTQEDPLPKNPYFIIRKQARIRSKQNSRISESSYVRAINRIFQSQISDRSYHNFKKIQSKVPHFQTQVFSSIIFLRKVLKLRNIKLTSNRGSQVLVFKEPLVKKWRTKVTRRSNFEFLHHTCGECFYFALRRKKHCYFFSQLMDEDLPSVFKNRINPKFPVFSTMVGCPMWRPRKTVLKNSGESFPTYCTHCYRLLPKRREYGKIKCKCETEYQLIRDNKTNAIIGFEYRLTAEHSIDHDLKILFPGYNVKLWVEQPSTDLLSQEFLPKTKDEFQQLMNSPQYVFIRDSDQLVYDTDQDLLGITDKAGKTRYRHLKEIILIDTQQMPGILLDILTDCPHIMYNYRSYHLTLSVDDSVHLIQKKQQIPALRIKRHRKKEKEIYFLHRISTIFNIGKPRLNPFFEQYGIKVIYSSIKGVLSHPVEEIKDALSFYDIRQVMSDIHLLGLVISALRATSHLIELMYYNNQPNLGEKIFFKMKRLLLRSPTQIYELYSPPKNINDSIAMKRSRFEGWIFRPFAEGIREFITKINEDNPLLPPKDGRNVSRRIWKHPKTGMDFIGGYSHYDSSLNTMNRRLRYQLRLWNAKIGFGFNTLPLFSHKTLDKPGRSGHLDLEEVGRIITRFVLADEIRAGNLRKRDFQPRFDDNNLIFYTPWTWQLKKIRHNFVQTAVLKKEIHYNNIWGPFADAHRQHVEHLRWCFEKVILIDSSLKRQQFLLKTYEPLVFHVRPLNKNGTEIQNELFNLFRYCWINRTGEMWNRVGKDPFSLISFISDPQLAERILSI